MQVGGQFQRVGAGSGAAAVLGEPGDRGQRVQAAAAGEHAHPPEHRRQGGGQQLIAPRDGVPQGLLAPRPARVGGSQGQALPEPGQQRLGREQLDPRRGQLDRQRQPVQPGADRRDVCGVAVSDRETGPYHLRLLGEQHRRAARRHLRGAATARNGQRRHRQLVFSPDMQRAPGCGQDHQPGRGRQQRRRHRGGAVKLLQVVQHQQGAAFAQVTGHHVRAGPVAGHVQAPGNRLPHHLAVTDRRQRDEIPAVRECLVQRRGGGQGQPGLADAARAGQRHQPDVRAGHGGAQGRQLVAAADQRRHRLREARPGAQAPQRRKPLRQARSGELVDVFRCLDVLQPVKAQVAEGNSGREVRRGQQPRRVGRHHLAAVRGRRDPGRPVHVQPHIRVLMPGRLPGMQAHPDPEADPAGPVVAGQVTLRRHAAADRVRGRVEHDEETVALGAHLMPAELAKQAAQNRALGRQRLPPLVAKTAQQRRRPLHVAEEHRYGPRGEFPHAPIISPHRPTADSNLRQAAPPQPRRGVSAQAGAWQRHATFI